MQSHIEDDDNSWMKQAAGRSRFPEEPFLHEFGFARIHTGLEVNYLDRNTPPDHGIDGIVHHSHGATSKFAVDQIAPDLFGVKWRGLQERFRRIARANQTL